MNGEQQYDADAGSSVEEMEFNWDEYLEDTGATAAPHGSFKHVDTSLQNGFAPGMKLEVAVKSDQNTYWVATIITTCGQLLLLRYDGYGEDRKADFWCDILTADLHPIGWCQQNKKILKVPEGIKDKIPDQEEFLQRVLKGACSAPANLLEGLHRGKNPLDLIAPGSRLELQNSRDSLEAWIVTVVENVGGRLKLRYEGLEDLDKFDQWLFYLDPFLHQVGWAAQHGYSLQPPSAIRSLRSEADWQEILKKVKEEEEESSVPTDLFKDKPVIGVHSFSEGMKLEAVDPMAPFVISPATVLKGTGCLIKQLLVVKPLDFNGGEKFHKDTSSKYQMMKIVKPRLLKLGVYPHNLSIHLETVFWGFDFVKVMSLLCTHDI